jgi:hypothetical protein
MEEEVYTTTTSRSMTQDVGDLVDTYIELAKANVTKKTAEAASYSVSGICMVVLACFAIFFAGFGLAWWLGQLLSSVTAGFLIVAGIFVVLLVLLMVFKEQLVHPIIRNMIVKKVYD